jgi:short subunit dehydrogenase
MKERGRPLYQRVWFITDSSTGSGRAVAEAVLARGERAVVASRTPERVRDLIERYPAQALVLELDISRPEHLRRALSEARDRFGSIDVLVNNTQASTKVLAQEVAPLGMTMTIVEPDGSGDRAGAVEYIVAAHDAPAIPRKYGTPIAPQGDAPAGQEPDDAVGIVKQTEIQEVE